MRGQCVRLPQVHDPIKQGLVTYLIALAREKGRVGLCRGRTQPLGGGARSDAARLYRLALEKHEAGAKYHAVAEEGVPLRDIAESIGRGLKMPVVTLSPEEAASHFGWLAMFAGPILRPPAKRRGRKWAGIRLDQA